MSKILVVGDLMLDVYIRGNVNRISPEAPVPVFLIERQNREYVLGGAANVALNIRAAGAKADVFGMVGNDESGKLIIDMLHEGQVGTTGIVCGNKPTTQKIRYLGQNNQQVLRVDIEETTEIEYAECSKNLDDIIDGIKKYQAVVFSDYNKGFLVQQICKKIIDACNRNGIPVLVDLKDKRFEKYSGATVLKPNKRELHELTDLCVNTIDQIEEAAVMLCKSARSKYVLTTLGAEGMLLVNDARKLQYEKTRAREVYDVTGAGDTTIAYLACELANGTDMHKAVRIANAAAGIQVSKLGTSVVYRDELRMIEEGEFSSCGELLCVSEQIKQIKAKKNRGQKIVFTNGCFDILHYGHVKYLQEAKAMGDVLVVGINSDDSVKRLKGKERPINSLADRIRVLSALDCVDYVLQFEEDTPINLINMIIPDVLVKGGDYNREEIVGYNEVIQNGGRVEILNYLEGKSTTNLIKKMREGDY